MGRATVAGIVSLWVVPISITVNRIVYDPYMDEIFHIPQAQRYCGGDFKSWDPMITTPPGLYYLSLTHVASLFPGMWFTKAASSLSELCSTSILRSANGALAIICSVLVYDIFIHMRPTMGERRATVYAIIMALYPIHWFFTFLYYTDVASVTAVLAMYLASLRGHYWISALLGAVGILIRQTNVVWILFVASIAAIDYADTHIIKDYVQPDDRKVSVIKSDVLTKERRGRATSDLRKRRAERPMGSIYPSVSKISGSSLKDGPGLLDEFRAIFLKLWCLKWKFLVSFAPFIMVLVAFMTFVFWNGSIVLGAKEAHVVSPHFAQIMYFGLVSAAAAAPIHFGLSQAMFIYKSFWKKKSVSLLQWPMALIMGFIAVHFFSIAHPYLLADNRHYTFYIWRKVIKAHWTMKYLLVPLYVYSWFSIISILEKTRGKIWALLFFLACAAVLIPAPLIEFRYYTIPIFLLILNSEIDDNVCWLLIAVLYIAVNIFTMAMFLLRPFHWAHEPGTQRFIW